MRREEASPETISLLDEALETPQGHLYQRGLNLSNLLEIGFRADMRDTPADEVIAVQKIRFEQNRLQEEKNKNHG